MNIFEPTMEDVKLLTPSIKQFIATYSGHLKPDEFICIRAIYRSVENPDVFTLFVVDDGKLVGYFLGRLTIEMFSGIKIAAQMGVMLLPEYSGHMFEMFNRFQNWGKERGAKRLYVHFVGRNERRDKVLNRKGFRPAETQYIKEL